MEEKDDLYYYYRGARDENSVARASSLFENIQDIQGSIGVRGEFLTDHSSFITIHNHMKSSNHWKSVSQWDTGVEYTIQHPAGDIVVSDTNRGQKTVVFRQDVLQTVRGSTACKLIDFTVKKYRTEELDCTSRRYHDSTYTSVKIKSEKVFVHESPRSSWNFHLAVVWQGDTKKKAESDPPRYSVAVSMGSVEKASNDAMYTTASFLEKLMDVMIQKHKSRHINLKFS
ncbi:unnamed protein product [Ectocarpus sp. 8 AP-2014]